MVRDIPWAAGLFEGEGTIGLRKRPEDQVYISLTSTDEDVVREFARIVNSGKVYGPYQYGDGKPFWKWDCYGLPGVNTLDMLSPFFLTRRKARAAEVVARYWQRRERPHYTVSRKGMGGKNHHKNYVPRASI